MLLTATRGETAHETISFTMQECCNCGIPFMLPTRQNEQFIKTGKEFYCPNGHAQHYSAKTEAQKIKEAEQKVRDEMGKQYSELQDKFLDTLGDKIKVEKQLRRLHRGVCPCCNRSFYNLQQHMQKQHPEVAKSIK